MSSLRNTLTPDQKKKNLRLALILASVAVVFCGGFMVKMLFFGSH